MKTVKVYYAGIPANNTKSEKRDVLTNFHLGVGEGGISKEIEGRKWEPCDLAVMQGWVHQSSQRSPHLMFRKQIIDMQRSIRKHTLAIDSNLFLYRDPGNTKQYLRFSLNDVFPTTGIYFTDRVDPDRWKQIKTDIGFDLQPWRESGDHVLICLQRNGGWSMGGLDVMKWLDRTVKRISAYTDRPIVVRAHPGDRRAKSYLRIRHKNVTISTNENILDDFKNCWAVVTYNSSPGVAAAIEGIPVFVTDPNPQNSQAFQIANRDLAFIEQPLTFSRQAWIEKIGMCHFNFNDLRNGTAWNIIKDYI
jgi:hypothetical protein